MRIAFLVADWADLSPTKSSTLTMIHESVLRGHRVYVIYPRNLTVRDNVAYGFARRVHVEGKCPESVSSFYKRVTLVEKMMPLHSIDAVFVRRDPPLDPIVLNFLDSVKSETVVLNDVDGIRKANNKIYTTSFHGISASALPETHVSKNKDYLKRVIRESDRERWILKPLDGSGGRGVILIETKAQGSMNSLLDFYIDSSHGQSNYVILQEYLEGAVDGDIRVLMLGGEYLGAYQRIPAPDDIRANIHAGGTAHTVTLTDEQHALLRKIGPVLMEDGLHFVGLDLIGNKLLEVNVLNPGGITNINRLKRVKLQRKVIDYVERLVEQRHAKRSELEIRLTRMNELREQADIAH
ncbi:MAG: glutathione synthetase [Gammaproteobacteria bacterium]|nr:glutathione synthetase [Gammaproteobacteria bacterium]